MTEKAAETQEQEPKHAAQDDPAMAGMLETMLPPAEEAKTEETGEKHEPKEGSDRWNKIYGKMKHLERQGEEKDANFKALVEHNKKLTESINDIQGRVAETPRPDPAEDPDGYDKWIMDKMTRSAKPATVPEFDMTQAQPQVLETAQQAAARNLKVQEAEMMENYDDYQFATQQVGKMMDNDFDLQNKIMSAKNPAMAAYRHYQKVKKNQNNLDRGSLDAGGGYEPPAPKQEKLSPAQKQMAKNFGLSEQQYADQLAFTRR